MSPRAAAANSSLFTLLGLMLAHFTNDFFANFLPVFIPLLHEKFQLSFTLVALLPSAYTAAASFFQLLFGYISDRLPRWRFALIGPLLTGSFMSLVGVLSGYGWVMGALLLAAMGTAMFHPQATALSGGLFSSRKGLYVSLFIAAGTLGFALGPALMALFIHTWGFERTPLALLLLFALGAAIWRLQGGLSSDPTSHPQYSGSPGQGASAETATSPPRRLRLCPLGVLWGLVVLRHVVLLAFLTFLLILLGERGAEYLEGSLLLFGFLIAGVVGGVLGGHLSDHFGRWRVAVWTLWLGFSAMLGFLALRELPSLVFLLVGGGFLNASNPVIIAHAQELLPGQAGTASAVVMGFAWGIGGLLISVVGALADVWGVEGALRASTLAAFALTILLTLLGRRALETTTGS